MQNLVAKVTLFPRSFGWLPLDQFGTVRTRDRSQLKLWPVFYSVHLYSDLTRLEFEWESQLFENETSPIFSGEKEKMKRDMLP